MDLYKELNIHEQSSDEEIKIAYRRAAKEHHPDKGGKIEKFKSIKLAYEVLSDKEKRQRYDETGIWDNKPNNEEAELRSNIAVLILNTIDQVGNLDQIDIIKKATETVLQGIHQNSLAINDARRKIAKYEKAKAKLKKKDAGENILADIIDSQIVQIELQIVQAEKESGKMEKMITMLNEYESEAAIKPEPKINIRDFVEIIRPPIEWPNCASK